MKIYRCYFEFLSNIFHVDSQPEVPAYNGVQAFKDGFWIKMEDYDKPVLSCNGDIWIAPASIKNIRIFERADKT